MPSCNGHGTAQRVSIKPESLVDSYLSELPLTTLTPHACMYVIGKIQTLWEAPVCRTFATTSEHTRPYALDERYSSTSLYALFDMTTLQPEALEQREGQQQSNDTKQFKQQQQLQEVLMLRVAKTGSFFWPI